jgi:hypothetical protein
MDRSGRRERGPPDRSGPAGSGRRPGGTAGPSAGRAGNGHDQAVETNGRVVAVRGRKAGVRVRLRTAASRGPVVADRDRVDGPRAGGSRLPIERPRDLPARRPACPRGGPVAGRAAATADQGRGRPAGRPGAGTACHLRAALAVDPAGLHHGRAACRRPAMDDRCAEGSDRPPLVLGRPGRRGGRRGAVVGIARLVRRLDQPSWPSVRRRQRCPSRVSSTATPAASSSSRSRSDVAQSRASRAAAR